MKDLFLILQDRIREIHRPAFSGVGEQMWAKRREKQEKYDKNPGSGKSDTKMKLSFPFCLCKRAPLSPGVLFFPLFFVSCCHKFPHCQIFFHGIRFFQPFDRIFRQINGLGISKTLYQYNREDINVKSGFQNKNSRGKIREQKNGRYRDIVPRQM